MSKKDRNRKNQQETQHKNAMFHLSSLKSQWKQIKQELLCVVRNAGCTRSRNTFKLSPIFKKN